MKHIVCFSLGHSSALTAIEVVRLLGKENVILVNHGMSKWVEEEDIRRFGWEVSAYLDIPVTQVNINGIADLDALPDQFDIAIKKKGFKQPRTGNALCTTYLKTEPFNEWLQLNFPDKDCRIYYGFDANETSRMQRRSSILGAMGYRTGYPLAHWKRTIRNTKEIGIQPPNIYNSFKHANCTGCLKAGLQHWYVVYCKRYDIFTKAKETEERLDYAILRRTVDGVIVKAYLEDLEPIFARMKCAGVPASEHVGRGVFASMLKKYDLEDANGDKPCECFV